MDNAFNFMVLLGSFIMPPLGNVLMLQTIFSVYTGYRHMEHWLHFCGTFNWKASFPREECCPSIGPHD
jgi:hypothetical protein